MTDTQALIARLEAATGNSAGLMREAFDALRPEPRQYDGFPWMKPRAEWVRWYEHWRWFEAALRIGAYESAALTLVPEGWAFSVGSNRKSGDAWARLEPDSDDLLDPRGVLVRRAPTPALAIVIAALRAIEARQQ